MASPLYTIDPHSPSINSSVLPNISTSRTISRPYTRQQTALFTAYPASSESSPPSGTSTSKSNSTKGSPKRIARPVNAFMLYRSAFLKESRIPAHAETRQQHLSKVIGQCWNMMCPDERAVWDAKAAEARQAHAAMYPHYKFSPKRKSRAQAAGSRRVSEAKRARDEEKEREEDEEIRRLRELWTQYKGEPVLSRRNEKKLTRSVRGTERAARPSKKAARSTSASAASSDSTSPLAGAATTSSTNSGITSPTSSSPTAPTPAPFIFSTLLSPLPLRLPFAQLASFLPPSTPFLPSSTHLTATPSAGPQITRITQSPPLTPFHPSDRQAQIQQVHHTQYVDAQQQQIQVPQLSFPIYEPCVGPVTAQWEGAMENAFDAFAAPNVNVCQGTVYPPMGVLGNYATASMPNPSAYFNHNGVREAQVVPNVGASMNMYLDFDTAGIDIDYSPFADAYTGIEMGISREAPTQTYAPAMAPSPSGSFGPCSEAWSSSSEIMSPASLAYPDSPVTSMSASGSTSGSACESPASLVYPDTPPSASFDSPDFITLAYPFPSPNATQEVTLSTPYTYGYTSPDAHVSTYPEHNIQYYPSSASGPQQQFSGVGGNGLQVELGSVGRF